MWARELVEPNQSEAARMLGMSQSGLNKIEKGTRTASIFNLIAMSRSFGVSTDYILKGSLSAATNTEIALKLAALHPELVLRGMAEYAHAP